MAFDPSSIKKTFSIEDLPEGASRDEKITALAEHLHERGLTASVGAAKRLAEGMVDTEQKVIDEGSTKSSDRSERKEFQKSDLYKAIGGTEQLDVADDFQLFIDRAKNATYQETRDAPSRPLETHKSVMYEEAPISPTSDLSEEEMEEVEEAQETWKVPSEKDDEGYEKTRVDASEDGVVVRHTQRTATQEIVEEEGVVKAPDDADVPKKEEKRAPEEDIDLFDIFRS